MGNKIKGFIEIKMYICGVCQRTLINVEKIINIEMKTNAYGDEYAIIVCENGTFHADETYDSIVEKIRASQFM